MKNKIIVITGPTGVGKTKCSIALAKLYNAEIINADSVSIYKDLNIGSAKVSIEEMDGIIHHLINIREINEYYSVYDYQRDCRKTISEIFEKNKNVIIVGGTGLYINAALYNYEFNDIKEYNNYDNYSNQELYNMLDNKENVHLNNRQRIISRLNSKNNKVDSDKLLYDCFFIGLTTKRENLYNIINDRVDNMTSSGLEKEVRKLYNKCGTSKILNSAIGYKEFIQYFKGETSYNETLENIKQNSRKYAKRQYTWFNNKLSIKWFDVDYVEFSNTIENIKEYINDKEEFI